jgi:hypothetical protein
MLKRSYHQYLSAAVADGSWWIGCVSSHVHTNRLLVWVALLVLATLLTL